ncbi:MAG: acyltransferase [Rhodanobacter sp.]|nr:acyltransferase [Rhodanobacter sp.]
MHSTQAQPKDLSAQGLRGIAALSVFFAHFFVCFFPLGLADYYDNIAMPDAFHGVIESAIGTPVLSALWNGQFAVCIFFVLSGHVLTKSFRSTGKADSIRSLAFRRYLRLGFPIFFSVMLSWVICRLGWLHIDDALRLTHSQWLAAREIHDASLWAALKDGLYGVILLGHTDFNTVFWTMRIEFIGSMLIFSYALIAYPDHRRYMLALIYLVLTFLLSPDMWPFYWAFLIGYHLDDVPSRIPSWGLWALVPVAVYLAGFNSSPLFAPLRAIPLNESILLSFYSTAAGALIVFCVLRGMGHGFLLSRPVQFLGRVSYPLYLTHCPIILSTGCYTYVVLHGHLGMSRALAAIAALAVSLPITLIVSAYFERWIDQPGIRFGKWLAA